MGIIHNSSRDASALISEILSKLDATFPSPFTSHAPRTHREKLKTPASLKFHPSRVCIAKGCTETEPRHAFAFNNTDNHPPWHADVLDAIRCVHTTTAQTPHLQNQTNPSVDDIDHHPSIVRRRRQLPSTPAPALSNDKDDLTTISLTPSTTPRQLHRIDTNVPLHTVSSGRNDDPATQRFFRKHHAQQPQETSEARIERGASTWRLLF